MDSKMYSNSKLTLADKENIIQLAQSSIPITQIAKKYNVSRPTIYKVVSDLSKTPSSNMDDLIHKKQLQALNIQRKLDLTIDAMRDLRMKSTLSKNEIFSGNGLNKAMENIKEYNGELCLNNICYEQIKDSFYYGVFGDFKLVIDKTTGYFNATKLCDAGGKHFRQWKILEKSKRMIKYYEESCRHNYDGSFLYEIKLQNNDKINKQITGTYAPQELILDIASWISVEFYHRCNRIIINYFVEEFKKMDNVDRKQKIKEVEKKMEELTIENQEKENTISEQKDKIDQLMDMVKSMGISIEEVKDQNDKLLYKTKGLKKQNKDIQRKLGIAVEERAPLPLDEDKQERFVLLKRNDERYFQYYTIRAQNAYTEHKLKVQKLLFPNMKVLLDLKCNPNSKTLYNRIKAELKAKKVEFSNNDIDLAGSEVTQEELVDEMKVINDQKYHV